MKNGFVNEVRQELQSQGSHPDHKPTHEWLIDNGFRQFLRRCRELGYTPDEFLLQECGFIKPPTQWPCSDQETIQWVEEWLDWQERSDGSVSNSIPTVKSHFRTLMRLSTEALGTSDLLTLGRGNRDVCWRRCQSLFLEINSQLGKNTRKQYARTLKKWMWEMKEREVVEHNVVGSVLESTKWPRKESNSPTVPTTKLVRAYINACETRCEQLLVISLAGWGLRADDITDSNAAEMPVLDVHIPHVPFTGSRKNGPGRVPIAVGLEFITEYIEILSLDPEYSGSLFPSNRSQDGSRCPQWVNDRLKEIGSRTNETLPNGEQPTAKHFRRWWYTRAMTAYREYIANADIVASVQGSSSGRVAANAYFDEEETWFPHYLQYMKDDLAVAFADFEPADTLGKIDTDVTIEDYKNAKKDQTTCGQTVLDAFDDATTHVSAGATATLAFLASRAAIGTSKAALLWATAKHTGMRLSSQFEHYPNMPLGRQLGFSMVLGSLLIGQLGIWAMNGTFSEFAAGNMAAVGPVLLGLLYGLWLFDRELPSANI